MAEPSQMRQRGGEDFGVVRSHGCHGASAATLPQHRPGRSLPRSCIAALGVFALLITGCGGDDHTTSSSTALTPQEIAMGLDHPLCSEIGTDGVTVPEDGNCRERPTCQEVDEGAELPADGVCLDLKDE